MKKFSIFFLFLPFLFSCASFGSKVLPPQAELVFEEPQDLIEEPLPQTEIGDADELPQDLTEESEAEIAEPQVLSALEKISRTKPETPKAPIYIMGEGKTDGEKLALFLLQSNPLADPDFVRVLASHYINESSYEGINHDVAFSQMCLETGFLAYGGLVEPDWNNFCGLGATGPDEPGLVFTDPQTGVRAHIQHLKAYATEEPLKGELVDPRYRYVQKGSSPAIDGLSGTWAADRQYAIKIRTILQRLYDYSL